jgi:hypothetical protein
MGSLDLELAPLRRLVGPYRVCPSSQELRSCEVAPQIAPAVCQEYRGSNGPTLVDSCRRDEDRRVVLGFRSLRKFMGKMGRRGRPEVLALQLPQSPEQLTVANLGPASKLLQEGGQECVALQHIQRVCGPDYLPLLRIRELKGQVRLP